MERGDISCVYNDPLHCRPIKSMHENITRLIPVWHSRPSDMISRKLSWSSVFRFRLIELRIFLRFLNFIAWDRNGIGGGSACGQGYSTSKTRFVSHPSLAEIVTWNRRRWTKTLEICFTALLYHNGSKELACHILFMCLLYILGLLCLKVNKMIQW